MRTLCWGLVSIAWIALGAASATAQQQVFSNDLVALTAGNPAFDDLERAAARANQSVYNALVGPCQTGPGPCSLQQFELFGKVRELMATANELNTGSPNSASLHLDAQGLGAALRWTAAEEVQAKSRVATEFANGQLANTTNRITALRFGATGF